MPKHDVLFSATNSASKQLIDQMHAHKIPGVSIAVIDKGKLDWAGGFGVLAAGGTRPVTADTLFQACSISKPIVAMAVLYLVQQGKLDLDEDINQKLITWKIPENALFKDQKVTLRRLLSHTAGTTVSGFRGYAADEQIPTLHQILDGLEPANSMPIRVDSIPGTQWRYSGGGFTIVQQLLTDRIGKAFPDILRDLILRPLDMQQSTYEQPLPVHLHEQAACGHDKAGVMIQGGWFTYPEMAAAGLWTTPSDLAQLAIELQQSKAGTSNRVLSVEATKEMLSDQVDNFPEDAVSQRYDRHIRNQGIGFHLEGQGISARFGHHGGNVGYSCFIIAYSEVGQGAVVMTNSDNGFALIPAIIQRIATEYGWDG